MRADRPIAPWPRWRLVVTLAGAASAVLLLVTACVLVIIRHGGPPNSEPNPIASSGGWSIRDRIATAPMMRVEPSAAITGVPARQPAATMQVPTATTTGPAEVPTGYPHSPEGAVGQLAAIEIRVVEAMSIPIAHQVHQEWVTSGGIDAADWELTEHVHAFLAAAEQQGDSRDDTTMITAIPAGAMVKGVDGPDWVLACVLLDVRASIVANARIGWGHCERMVWTGGRWLIGPGTPPAAAPSTWLGSEAAVQAGWLAWREATR